MIIIVYYYNIIMIYYYNMLTFKPSLLLISGSQRAHKPSCVLWHRFLKDRSDICGEEVGGDSDEEREREEGGEEEGEERGVEAGEEEEVNGPGGEEEVANGEGERESPIEITRGRTRERVPR